MYRAHLAALVTTLVGGFVLALAGAAYELARCHRPHRLSELATVLAAGLVTAAICALVGAAIGAFCNPPVLRQPAGGILSTTGAIVVALVAGVSPANAALRGVGSAPHPAAWLTGLPLLVAIVLLAVSWLVSTLLAARRGG